MTAEKYQVPKMSVSLKAIVFNKAGNMLAVRRSGTAPNRPGYWDLPGGVLELGEEPKDAIAREIFEETGLRPDTMRFLDSAQWREGDGDWLTECYTAEVNTNDVVLSYEHDAFQWLSPIQFEKLPVLDLHKRFVAAFMDQTKGDVTKRSANLIPYRMQGEQAQVFLQKSGKDARVLSEKFSFFGGKVEPGETPEQAVVREIKEELNYDLREFRFLGEYESFLGPSHMLHLYYARVGDNFENEVTVLEDEYGKFFTEAEAAQEPKLMESDKRILRDFFKRVTVVP